MKNKKKKKGSLANKVVMIPYYIWLLFFILIPLALVVMYAFSPNEDGFSFSLENFAMLVDPLYLSVLLRSLGFAFIATVCCLLIGYPIAMILSDEKRRNNPTYFILFIAPMGMNFLLRTYAWLTLLEDTGMINQFLEFIGIGKMQLLYNDAAVIMGMIYNLLPFMIFPLYTSISKIPKHILESSYDLGGNFWQTLMRVILPLSVPGIISGITMVFVPSVTTFVLSRLLGGGKTPLIGDIIEQQFGTASNWHYGSALSLLVMLVIVLCMWFVNKWSDDDEEANIIW